MSLTLLQLIALAAIVGADFGLTQDFAEGAAFNASQEQADALIAAGLAKLADTKEADLPDPHDPAKPPEPPRSPSKSKQVKARVLMACNYGNPDDLVTLSEAEAKQAQDAGQVDTHKEAVAYAASLPQNKK